MGMDLKVLEQDESNIILDQVSFSDIIALYNDSAFKELVQKAEDHCNSLFDWPHTLKSRKMRLICLSLSLL